MNNDIYDVKVQLIARVCHEANRAWCQAHGDELHDAWPIMSQALRDTTARGVVAMLKNLDMTAEESHSRWMDDKIKQGYVYGPVKDNDKKTHPCMLPYAELAEVDRKKDELFRAIARTLA